jgi:hypothetical protein
MAWALLAICLAGFGTHRALRTYQEAHATLVEEHVIEGTGLRYEIYGIPELNFPFSLGMPGDGYNWNQKGLVKIYNRHNQLVVTTRIQNIESGIFVDSGTLQVDDRGWCNGGSWNVKELNIKR